ncbi:MAG TPA: hypothetical protein VEX68_09750, partial [Bryobacteraceae bacterium]|nr:hypothetical protein [Bryobacteraceae bacterium]
MIALVNAELLFAQRVSFGFMGGTNLTWDFPSSYLVHVVHVDPSIPGELTTFERYSDRRGFIAGLSIEVDLGKGLALEGNALRRQLQLKGRTILPDGGMRDEVTTDIGTWEWPILMKYRMPAVRAVRPFIEAGPSFRTRHYPGASEPSQIGGTVGAGVEFRVGKFRVSPTFRYTRWQYDDVGYPRVDTKRDQIEFSTSISYATSLPSWKVGGRKLRFGFIGGAPLTPGLEQPSPPQRIEELTGYMGGLAVEVELNRHWSVEVNGLYRPFRADRISSHPSFGESQFEFTVLTWQFPVLGKYRFRP